MKNSQMLLEQGCMTSELKSIYRFSNFNGYDCFLGFSVLNSLLIYRDA